MAEVIGSDKLYAFSTQPEGDSDNFLIEADKTPNKASFDVLNLTKGLDALQADLTAGGIQVLIVSRQDIVGQLPAEIAEAVKQVPNLIVMGTHKDATAAAATVFLPATTHAESYASFVNSAKRVQKVAAVVHPTDDMAPVWDWLTAMATPLQAGWGYGDVEGVWAVLRDEIPALAGLGYYKLPESGVSLQPEMAVAQ
jgi:formate dehydrogenase major subunit